MCKMGLAEAGYHFCIAFFFLAFNMNLRDSRESNVNMFAKNPFQAAEGRTPSQKSWDNLNINEIRINTG